MTSWTPESWQTKVAAQQPLYPDKAVLDQVIGEIRQLPPLVTSWEVESLRALLARAGKGEVFILQGGDCAESFDDCRADPIAAKLKILMQMSLVLVHGTRRPVVRIGRMAGQYAKPRSADNETRGETTLPAYRGDLVNRDAFTTADRTPDAWLMLRAYERASLTLNFVRALADGGFADMRHPENWDLSFAKSSPHAAAYERIVTSIRDSLEFARSFGGTHTPAAERVDFYTSHEALALYYEQAATRVVPRRDGWYNLSTHFPWIGMRTAELDGAHVEYHRGIANPLGIKIGPAMTKAWLLALLDRLDPQRLPGRISLIHRMGAGLVDKHLPSMIEAITSVNRQVTWICDPMHGNTETTAGGIKTRRFDRICEELERSIAIHRSCGSVLGGMHLELTGDDVTECLGGARGLEEHDLARAYRSRVDPRLNYEQALEVAMRVSAGLRVFSL